MKGARGASAKYILEITRIWTTCFKFPIIDIKFYFVKGFFLRNLTNILCQIALL